MIDTGKVISLSALLYGLNPEEENLFPYAEAVCGQIQSRMNKNADPDDIRILRLCAAALNRMIRLRNACGDNDITSFKAGDVAVSLSPREAENKCEKELSEATTLAAPLLKDEGFTFRQV
ncbi:MAG: hypothetical protein MJ125_04130 [Clostridia bacterium]|nr:hypothetical protein [Clostridia bacterium]